MMSEDYRKIAIKNVCVAEVCFRMIDKLFNVGNVILDIDTFDFAGFLTDDVIVGYYRDGIYTIYYYYNHIVLDLEGSDFDSVQIRQQGNYGFDYEHYEISFQVPILIDKLPDSFTDRRIIFDGGNYELTFNHLMGGTAEELQEIIIYNKRLLLPREA